MATYYWVGGNGTWDNSTKTNWATSSGGAGGNGPPTSADTVNFDSNSGTGTASVASGAACNNLTINSANMTVQLGVNLTVTGATTVSAGTLDINGYTLTTDSVTSTANATRTIAFGSTGKIVCTRTVSVTYAVDFYNATTAATLTGTPTVDFTGNFSAQSGIRPPSTTYTSINVNVKAGTGTFNLASSFGYNNVDFTGFAGTLVNGSHNIYGNLTLASGMTVGAGTSVLSFLATSGTQKFTSAGITFDRPIIIGSATAAPTVQLQDNLTVGSTRAVTLTNGTFDLNDKTLSCGIFSSSTSNTRSISFGTSNITLTGNATTIWNASVATGLSFTGTPTINCIYSGSIGTRTIANGGSSGGSSAIALNINVTAGTDVFTISSDSYANNVNTTGWVGQFGGAFKCYGNLTVSSGSTTYSGIGAIQFLGSGTQTITMNGVVWDRPVTFDSTTGTFVMVGAFSTTSTRAVTLTNGTLKLAAGTTNTVGSFVTNGTNQKYLQSTVPGTQATISDASGVNSVSYLTISDSFATGGATWDAFYSNGNIDAGNNTNWDFGATPVLGAEYEYKLRSFTEPRRF